MTQYEIETSGKTVTTIHHEARTFMSFSPDENPVKVTIFEKDFCLAWASIDTDWEGDYIPEPIIKVGFVSLLKNGKAGQAFNHRHFSITDIGKWIVGEEDTFKEMFKQHAITIENILQEKAVA